MKHRLILLATTLCLAAVPAWAQSSDGEFHALRRSHKTSELEALARQRVAASPQDEVALWHWSQAVAADARKREDLRPHLEQCVKVRPQSARCHHALGTLHAAAAASGGLAAGLKLAPQVKELYLKAVELDPANFRMRRDLNQFYLQAPGIVGGSVRKAVDNARSFAGLDATGAKLLQIDIHAYEKEFTQAEALLRTVTPGNDRERSEEVRLSAFGLGIALIDHAEPARAQKLFEQLVSEDPHEATGHFGLGRALLAQNLFDPAVASLERALQADPTLRAHYRLGLAYEGRGDRARAAASFRQFLAYAPPGKAADDARKRLDEMKG